MDLGPASIVGENAVLRAESRASDPPRAYAGNLCYKADSKMSSTAHRALRCLNTQSLAGKSASLDTT